MREPALDLLLRPLALLGLAGANRGDPLGDRNLEALGRRLRVVEARHGDARKPLPDLPFDRREIGRLLRRNEGEGVAGHLGPGGAPDAVDVVLGDVGDVEVDHVGQGLDVDAARGDVRGHEDAELAVLESGQGLRALRLGAVAVDALAGNTLLRQRLGQAVGPMLRAGEHEDVLDVAPLQELDQERRLEVLGDGVDRLRDPDGGRGLALEVDGERIPEHLARELLDRRRHRRRKEQRLAARRQVLENPADVREEAHVEHPVGLVEDEDLEPLQLRVGKAEVVEQPSGGRDQDVGARAERVLLGPHRHAAEDGGGREGRVDGELLGVFLDLRRQLARRREDEGARDPALLVHELLKNGQEKRRGLAAAGHGAGQHVAALHGRWDRVGLDRRGAGESHLLDAAQELRSKSKLRERQSESSSRQNPAVCYGNGGIAGEAYVRGVGRPRRPATRARSVSQTDRKRKRGRPGVRSSNFGL